MNKYFVGILNLWIAPLTKNKNDFTVIRIHVSNVTKFLDVLHSYMDFVWSDQVKLTELRCPCCINTLLKKHKHIPSNGNLDHEIPTG